MKREEEEPCSCFHAPSCAGTEAPTLPRVLQLTRLNQSNGVLAHQQRSLRFEGWSSAGVLWLPLLQPSSGVPGSTTFALYMGSNTEAEKSPLTHFFPMLLPTLLGFQDILLNSWLEKATSTVLHEQRLLSQKWELF